MTQDNSQRRSYESDSSELSQEDLGVVEKGRQAILRGESFGAVDLLADLTGETEPPSAGAAQAVAKERVDLPTIPKLLHVIWVGPHDPPQEAIDSWADKHVQGWLFTLWRDHQQGWENQEQMTQRAARGEWNGVADLMRYEILFKYGGFAVDADSVCVCPLDEGPEDFLHHTTAIACYENESVRPGMVGCGFLAAPRGSEFFGACIERASLEDPKEPAWKTVGPMLVTRVTAEFPDAIRIFPARMFAPEHYSGAQAPGSAAIYARQLWGTTLGYNRTRKQPCRCDICRRDIPFIFR